MFPAEDFAENSQNAVLETFDEKCMKQTVVKITERKHNFHQKRYRYNEFPSFFFVFRRATKTPKLKTSSDNKNNHNDDDNNNNNSMLRIFPAKPFHPHSCCQLYMANEDDPKALLMNLMITSPINFISEACKTGECKLRDFPKNTKLP